MHWFYLALAIVFEVGGTTCMKLSEGLTKPIFAALIFVLYGVSFGCCSRSRSRRSISACRTRFGRASGPRQSP